MSPPTQKGVMSSRLMAMAFMQRGAAREALSSPASTPASNPSGPPAKRMRLSNGSAATNSPTPAKEEEMQAMLTYEELHQKQTLDKLAAEAGESRWVLSVREPKPVESTGFHIVQASWADIDSAERRKSDGEQVPAFLGRISYGKKMEIPVSTVDRRNEDDDESDGEIKEPSSEDDPDAEYDPMEELIKQERRKAAAKKLADRKGTKQSTHAAMNQRSQERRKKEVNLNRTTSISGGASGSHSGSPYHRGSDKRECFNCGKTGHISKDCPQRRRSPPEQRKRKW